jgi:hypothetical protein
MAFSKVPVNSTYQTKYIPLVREMNSRGSSIFKDEYYTNVFPENVKNKITNDKELNLIKRSGSSQFIAGTGTTLRGSFNWKDQSRLFKCIDRDVYIYSTLDGSLVAHLVNVVGVGVTRVGFCTYLYDDGTVKVVVTDGTTLSTIDAANAVVASADPDLPTPHLPTPFFYDGYLLLVKSNTADCYNSDLNDPLAWTAGNFITAEMRADTVTAIVTLNNYFLLLGNRSIEYFWDAGNDTGTPFQRNDTPIKLNGYIGGLTQFGNKVFLVGEEVEGEPNVFMLEDFKMTPVGDEAVRRFLSSQTLNNLTGNVISIDGNDLYVLSGTTSTYFMVLETKLWGLLTYQNNLTFPIMDAFTINTAVGNKTLFSLTTGTATYQFDPQLYQDSGVNFSCTIVTDTQMFETWNNKFMSSVIPWCDRTEVDANLQIQWTDDDYITYSNPRTVNLNQERPDISQLGRFRKRAFKLIYSANQPLRISKLEVGLNLGTT